MEEFGRFGSSNPAALSKAELCAALRDTECGVEVAEHARCANLIFAELAARDHSEQEEGTVALRVNAHPRVEGRR